MKVRNTVQQIPYSFYAKYVTGALPIWINLEYPTINALICGNTSISTFPILPNEEFTFDYNEKREIELEFGFRKSKDKER
jgi:hypothetical protein